MNHGHISFFVSSTEDLIVSRRGSEVIIGQVSYEDWQDDFSGFSGKAYECFHSSKNGGRESIYDCPFKYGRWTKKIPLPWKNFHRKLWDMKPLEEETPLPEWYLDWEHPSAPPTLERVGNSAQFEQWATANAKRQHWYGNREMFKTWTFPAPTQIVIDELAPMLKGSDFVIKIKCW